MKALKRWSLYFRKPQEPDIFLSEEEIQWWESVAWPIRSRTFVQALVSIVIGTAAGFGIVKLISLATDGELRPMGGLSFGFMIVMGGFFTAIGWSHTLTARRNEMIRSRRLLAAMKLYASPAASTKSEAEVTK